MIFSLRKSRDPHNHAFPQTGLCKRDEQRGVRYQVPARIPRPRRHAFAPTRKHSRAIRANAWHPRGLCNGIMGTTPRREIAFGRAPKPSKHRWGSHGLDRPSLVFPFWPSVHATSDRGGANKGGEAGPHPGGFSPMLTPRAWHPPARPLWHTSTPPHILNGGCVFTERRAPARCDLRNALARALGFVANLPSSPRLAKVTQ